MRSWLLAVLVSMLLAGCGSTPPVPEDHYYRLAVPVRTALPGWRFERPLRVLVPEADSLYHGRAMLYAESDTPLELHRYRYRFWTAPPPRLLARLTRDLLGAHAAEPGEPALELALRIRHFEAELGSASRARVALLAVLRDPDADCVLLAREYRYAEPVRAHGHYALVEAFQRALEHYLNDLADDLARAPASCRHPATARAE